MCTLALQVARLKGSFHGTPGPDIYYDEIIEIIHARKLREKGAKVTVTWVEMSTDRKLNGLPTGVDNCTGAV